MILKFSHRACAMSILSKGSLWCMGRELTALPWRITPCMTIQPNAQFIVSPGSHLNNDNAVVLGGSVTIRF